MAARTCVPASTVISSIRSACFVPPVGGGASPRAASPAAAPDRLFAFVAMALEPGEFPGSREA